MLSESCSPSAMGIDSSASLSWPPSSNRRVSHTPARLRLKEERKRIIRALDAKYRTIDDHERGMLRFVLIRNNLRRLQREAREEKLARHRANNLSGSKVSNLSPSCLSAAARSRSPSPPNDYGYADPISSPFTGLGSTPSLVDEDEPPAKRPCLFFDDDKENEMEVDDPFRHHSQGQPEMIALESKSTPTVVSPCKPVDDAQEILRDLYETCVSEGITSRSTSYADMFCTQPQQSQNASFSLSMSATCSVSSNLNNSSVSSSSSTASSCHSNNGSCENDWPTKHSQYPFNCGQSSLLGNDLQSVVFHSLITSLES